MTLDILKTWGVKYEINKEKTIFKVFSGISAPEKYAIPSDMSSASYPILWSILNKKEVCIENFGEVTLQGDEGFLEVAEKIGAKILRQGEKCFIYPPEIIQPIGRFDWSEMPDVSMTGMILASCVNGESYFTGLESLRVKECDRIVAMEQLKQFGVSFEIIGDDVKIIGNSKLIKSNLQNINSFDDHRIAMCFGVLRMYLGLGIDFYNKSWFKISEANCVAKTWPNFWLDFAEIENQLRNVSSIIVKNQEQYLIVKKPRTNFSWQFPQGGVDGHETCLQAAKRELKEECGFDLSIKFKGEKSLGTYKYFFPKEFKRHEKDILGVKIQVFEADYLSGKVLVDNDEIIDYKWVKKIELKKYFEDTYLEKNNLFLR
jgi:8-oxo-dGTP pyrophosphatase MutT (NUDIX family)